MVLSDRQQEEADKMRRQAEIDQEVNRAREHLRSQVATLAVAGAEQILRADIDAAAHQEMMDKLAAEL